ncbi:hypothetical protein T440DRAFT_3937 [Plenodomus tracheiphilus IPT5]|uniref:Uncharacterized protein n=1 Tax=Plenodomus tracheiphilus IPT5 TaxID=1408161 RepID=A0A6A7BMC4_9PLEO|nr:hypothetical protein T440DRAFT_3937 [Plenodomus tracheiphilus IPT5]
MGGPWHCDETSCSIASCRTASWLPPWYFSYATFFSNVVISGNANSRLARCTLATTFAVHSPFDLSMPAIVIRRESCYQPRCTLGNRYEPWPSAEDLWRDANILFEYQCPRTYSSVFVNRWRVHRGLFTGLGGTVNPSGDLILTADPLPICYRGPARSQLSGYYASFSCSNSNAEAVPLVRIRRNKCKVKLEHVPANMSISAWPSTTRTYTSR